MKMTNVLFGSDIEWFLRDTVSKDIITGEGLVKGTKDEPFVLDEVEDGFKSSLDNVLIEGNIPPVQTREEWLAKISKLYGYLTEMVPANIQLEAMSDARLKDKYLASKHARTFGCSVSFLAWDEGTKDNPPMSEVGNLRSAGFHVHASWDGGNDWHQQCLWVKAMDYYVGVPAVLIEPDNERRKLYGKAGEFRPGMAYDGAEYRVLSSFFAKDAELQGWVFDQTQKAINAINTDRLDFLKDGERIQAAINTGDRGLASALVHLNY